MYICVYLQMQKCFSSVCVSLVFCAILTETIGLVIAVRACCFLRIVYAVHVDTEELTTENSLRNSNAAVDSICLCDCNRCIFLRIHSFKSKAKEKRGWTLNSAGYLLGPRECYSPSFSYSVIF